MEHEISKEIKEGYFFNAFDELLKEIG